MTTLRTQYPLTILGRVRDVFRSGDHAWRIRRPSKRAQENARLEVAIHAAHVRTRQTYGPERLQAELRDDGFMAGVCRIKRLRKKLGLRCVQMRRFKATTNSNHALPGADNRGAQPFAATRPNEGWGTDITDGPTAEGWLYLADGTDLHTCEAGGHAMDARMRTDVVSQALLMAVGAKRPHPGLLHHSDRNIVCAQDYQDPLQQFGLIPSMSRRGNCYDNAPMESFWGDTEERMGASPAVRYTAAGSTRDRGGHRSVLQPTAAPFPAGESLAGGLCPAVGPSTAGRVRRQFMASTIDNRGQSNVGGNHHGEVGDGTRTDRSSPVDVVALSGGVKAIASGWRHVCALMTDGAMGDDTGIDRKTPVDVVTAPGGATTIAAGGEYTCALAKGTIRCWGENEDGQLGDGTFKITLVKKTEPGG
jgi:transposase InsO family protein